MSKSCPAPPYIRKREDAVHDATWFEKAGESSAFRATVRVMVLVIVVAIATGLWLL